MEQKDKEIMDSINEFLLYCKGFYKHSGDTIADIVSLLRPTYLCTTEKDVVQIIMNRWSEWNERLPQKEKMSVQKFWYNINDKKELNMFINSYHGNHTAQELSFNILSLMVIMDHIRYIDPIFLNLAPPSYHKGKLRYGVDKYGMTYKQMSKEASRYFK